MICREVPLSTLRIENTLLEGGHVDQEAQCFAAGAMAALQWLLDPTVNPAPHEVLMLREGKTLLQ